MNTLAKVTLSAALILSIAVPFIAFMIGEKTKGRYKKALAGNIVMFFGVMAMPAYCSSQVTLMRQVRQQLQAQQVLDIFQQHFQ